MEYAISHSALAKIKADCVILPLSSDATLPENLPDETREAVKAFIKAGDFSGDKGQTAWLHQPPGLTASRLFLVGCGDKSELDGNAFLKLVGQVSRTLQRGPAKQAVWVLGSVAVARDTEWQVRDAPGWRKKPPTGSTCTAAKRPRRRP